MLANTAMMAISNRCGDGADRELSRAASAGDEQARRVIANRLLTPVRATVSYLAGGGADADDLAQSAMIEILVAIDSFRGECSLEHWAKRIAARVVYRHLKKRGRRTRLRDESWIPSRVQCGVDERAELKAVRVRLSALLQRVSANLRTALVLHFVEGYTASEVAEIVDVPLGTARDRLHRGRAKLGKLVLEDPVLREWFEEREK